MARLRDRLRKLYHGRTPAAFRFQLAAVIIDLAIIAFFIATPVLQDKPPSCGSTIPWRRWSPPT